MQALNFLVAMQALLDLPVTMQVLNLSQGAHITSRDSIVIPIQYSASERISRHLDLGALAMKEGGKAMDGDVLDGDIEHEQHGAGSTLFYIVVVHCYENLKGK
ncbi:hypothetical protein SDJN03_12898, partial [Cucurbita argyrosperma subsp. sororia]